MSNKNNKIKRYIIQLSGIVQGVGFRPYVYKRAKEHNIYGWVNNAGASVVIDAEGDRIALKKFILDIIKRPPLLANIEKVEIQFKKGIGYEKFEIIHSNKETSKIKQISSDMAVCNKCMEEVFDFSSRRHRYAFTNCTECGPRYSIIEALPYDRCNTTMKDFIMCEQCESEYHNPGSRRFHTQPNCCSHCGPELTLMDGSKKEIKNMDLIQKTAEFIKDGSIIAIKGVGGFNLCCDAKNELAVAKLRERKNRPDKPLAVMMKNIDILNRYCELSRHEQEILTNQRRPIVLLKKKVVYDLPNNIAPFQKRLGVMLPYFPIHHLLFEEGIEVLIMTSGNMSETPIEYNNTEAFKNLNEVADYFLFNNRNIHNPIDDSVVKVVEDREMVSRRARGYIPYAKNIGIKHEIVALGAEQKSTFCVTQNGYFYLSQYLGDLKDIDSYNLYKCVLDNFMCLVNVIPKVYAHDLHPLYLSTRYAQEQRGVKIPVQHHHAHMVSCMVEHELYNEVIGVIFDGTGLGTDGNIWGGEFLIGDRRNFKRVGRLKPVLLQGGDTVVKEPWKAAVSYLFSLGYDGKDYFDTVSKSDIEIVQQALISELNCNWSSSMGRFFDCIAALIGLRQHTSYEAQAATELESIIDSTVNINYEYSIQIKDNLFEFNYESVISGVLLDIKHNVLQSVISSKFHNTIACAVTDIVCRLRNKYGISDVVLSGGVFENIYLLEKVYQMLRNSGMRVCFNEQIPINDSGISVGQLVVANEIMKEW